MNLLVDTNVVISALIRDGIPRRVVNEVVARDNWFWIVTEEKRNTMRSLRVAIHEALAVASSSRPHHG